MKTFISDLMGFEKDATLWYPDRPDEKYHGRVRYDNNEGITVSLLTSSPLAEQFSDLSSASSNHRPVVLLGDMMELGPITLFNGFNKKSNLGSSGPQRKDYYFNHAYLGIHSPDPLNEYFISVAVQPRHIEAWLAITPFKTSLPKFDSVEILRPKDTSYDLGKHGILQVKWSIQTQNPSQTETVLKAFPWIDLELSTPKSCDQLHQSISRVIHFFDLISDHCFEFASMRLRSTNWTYSSTKSSKSRPIPIYYLGCRPTKSKQKDSVTFNDLLFSSKHIDCVDAPLIQWLDLFNDCGSALNSYMLSKLEKGGFVETKLFIYASIAEALHRSSPDKKQKLFDTTFTPESIDQILNQVPDDLRNTVKGKLGWLNSPTFFERLQEFVTDLKPFIEDVIGDSEDQYLFCQKVKDWRNEQAHMLEPHKKYESREGIDFVRVASKLKIVIDFHLLLKLGMNRELIERRMRDNSQYWFYASRESWPWHTQC